MREETVALSTIYTEPFQLVVGIDEAETVAIGKRSGASHIERVAANLLDGAYKFAHSLGCIRRKDVSLPTIQEIAGETPIEGLLQIGLETVSHPTLRGSAISLRMLGNDGIEALAIGRNDILDVGNVLQSALNLERTGTCLHQFLQMLQLAHVLQRQQVTLVFQFASVGIKQIELHAAELRTLATIGRTLEAIL